MSEQLAFDVPLRPLARREDPHTSHVAAARADEFLAHHQALIVEALKRGPGHIYDIAERTGDELDHIQVARRLKAMTEVCRTGETKKGPKGRPCAIWMLKT
jgi:hypothetical protein